MYTFATRITDCTFSSIRDLDPRDHVELCVPWPMSARLNVLLDSRGFDTILDVCSARFEGNRLNCVAVPSLRYSSGDLCVDITANAQNLHEKRSPNANGGCFGVAETELCSPCFRVHSDFVDWEWVFIERLIRKARSFDDVAQPYGGVWRRFTRGCKEICQHDAMHTDF